MPGGPPSDDGTTIQSINRRRLPFPAPLNLGLKVDDHSIDQSALIGRKHIAFAALDQIGKRTLQVSRLA